MKNFYGVVEFDSTKTAISLDQLAAQTDRLGKSRYGHYIRRVFEEQLF